LDRDGVQAIPVRTYLVSDYTLTNDRFQSLLVSPLNEDALLPGHLQRGVFAVQSWSGLESEHGTGVLVSQHIHKPVWALAHIPDPLFEILEVVFSPHGPTLFIEHVPFEPLAFQGANKKTPLPPRNSVTRVERQS